MRLTTFSDYTLRVLIYLAVQEHSVTTIAGIAEAYGISKNHLMKVVHQLAGDGYVETTRGKGGGVRLKQAPEAISIGAVLRRTEADSVLVECFRPQGSECRIETACMLRGIFHQAEEAFYGVLDDITLAQVVENRARLQALLPGTAD
ncbi:DNA-binding protein [Thiohalobacter sp. COW1]|uniref:Transcriptional regulator n=1 Tax=Thiohalobacter thiocyanaticus TaxID=585455 RepID=A0A1Z4VPD5_9GAMM|nr:MULTISPECIES: Rrf2 family transcriptional regulator [Thiohalobacter]BAZ93292.1 transcriptional regulator [Thiohalobacter thiocyanaticus]BCO31680.1 DNA-binding protein [Thiohalobacter sp. COW1]